MIIAVINGYNGTLFTRGFDLNSLIATYKMKKLLFPIPGQYNLNFDSKYLTGNLINQYYFTDQNGVITFNQLTFSEGGVIGQYLIRFFCEGYFVDSQWITVTSNVNSISFLQCSIRTLKFDTIEDFQENFSPMISVLNENSKPVPNKSPILNTVDKSSENENTHLFLAF